MLVLSSSDFTPIYQIHRDGVLGRFKPKEKLEHLARKVELGHIVVTSGGKLKCQYVFHAAIVDPFQDVWPDEDLVRTATRNCLTCGRALGLKSIAFPILGGGTASNPDMAPAQSFQYITNEIAKFARSEANYEYIQVYVYKLKDVNGNPTPLVDNALGQTSSS